MPMVQIVNTLQAGMLLKNYVIVQLIIYVEVSVLN